MKAVSFSGEFAVLSIGGSAKGVIAIGGTAYGVIAIGGIASAGVISIGMNSIGSVVAVGMNAAAPISISLINGLGIYTLAGVNGWGAISGAGINALGLTTDGGVNNDVSVIPALVVIAALIAAAFMVTGERAPRTGLPTISLRKFVRSSIDEADVRAKLLAVRDEELELAGSGERIVVDADARLVAAARALTEANERPRVVVHLLRTEEIVREAEQTGYRDAAPATTRVVVRSDSIAMAPPSRWLPESESELSWLVGWTIKLAALGSIITVAYLVM